MGISKILVLSSALGLTASFLLSACGSDSSDTGRTSGTAGAAGTGGSAGVGGASGASGGSGTAGQGGTAGADATCKDACAVVHSCWDITKPNTPTDVPPFDDAICRAQCLVELKGEGTLAKEVANRIFTNTANHGPDPDCELVDFNGYGFFPYVKEYTDASETGSAFTVSEQVLFDACVQRYYNCRALGSDELFKFIPSCFVAYYRFNDATRNDIASCDTLVDTTPQDCDAWSQCQATKIPYSYDVLNPWYGKQPIMEYYYNQSLTP